MTAVCMQTALIVVATHVLILQAKVLKPDVPQVHCNKKIDLAVILDSSASVGNETYERTKDFTKDLIKRFTFGENKSRFSIMSYAFYSYIPVHFKDFNKFQSFEKSVNSLAWEGSTTFTDRALQSARFDMFSPKYGSRPYQKDVKRVAIIFTDGQSTTGLNETTFFVKPLKETGIEVFVVALGNRVSKKEVSLTASNPKGVFYFAPNQEQEKDNLLNDLVDAVCK